MVNYDYMRGELAAMLPLYKICSDCYEGEVAVKRQTRIYNGSAANGGGSAGAVNYSPYLPDPSPPHEDIKVRRARYQQYIDRAVFYNVTRRTVKAMVSAVFAKYPLMTLDSLDYLEANVNGGGVSIAQQSKEALTEVMLKGRVGLLADMPVNAEGVTKAHMETGGIRPVIRLYKAENIINWRTCRVGANNCLSLVVLRESYVKKDDGFKAELGEQLLILRLDDHNAATAERMQKNDGGEWISQGVNYITDYNGQPLDYIPFFFVGSENNDEVIDDIPIYDIAQLNIAHFRDSADYQEANFIAGQPTLVLSGLDQGWIDVNLSEGVSIGSRSGIMLPEGGSAQLLQPQPNSVNMEAMLHKEQLMRTLGAKLIEAGGSRAKTATEAEGDQAEQSSVLSNIANNVSDGYTKALKTCADYMGVKRDDLVITLNTQFDYNKMNVQQRMQLIAEWQSGAISWDEMRHALVESEIALEENPELAKQIIEREQGDFLNLFSAANRQDGDNNSGNDSADNE